MCWHEGLNRENNPFSTLSWLSTSHSAAVPWPSSGKAKRRRKMSSCDTRRGWRSVGCGEQMLPYAMSVLHKN